MSLFALKPRTQLLLASLLPLGCLVLAAILIWPSVANLRKVHNDLKATKKEILQKQDVITQVEKVAGDRPLALAVALPDEQEPIIFLRQLSQLTAESGVTLAAVKETTPPPLPAAEEELPQGSLSGPPPSARGTGSALGGQRPVVPASVVRELTDQVTVEGTFNQILNLFVRLEKFDRILSLSQCQITVGGAALYPKLQATFTLSRFVAKTGQPATSVVR